MSWETFMAAAPRGVIDEEPQAASPPRRKTPFRAYEPKDINFIELCQQRYPGKSWKELSLQDQTRLIDSALKCEHFLLDPHSREMRHWDVVMLLALSFTGLVTPYEVVFKQDIDVPLFVTNRIVDLVFVVDMILQLFLKVEIKQKGKYGTMLMRDPKALRWRYFRRWFFLDLVSIVPFDVFLLALGEDHAHHVELQGMKLFRCLRLCRLMKLLRILRTSRIMLRWQNYLAIPFSHQKFLKFSMVLLLASHWMACLWGGVGLTVGKDLCPDPSQGSLELDVVPLEEVSWVTALYTETKRSPSDPCNHFHTYLAALHWSVMTITSIGYGDVFPVRDVEYVVCIGCMLLGGVLWAYVIGSACSILSNMHPVEENFETNTDLLNMVMKEVNMPSHRKEIYREFLREAKVHDAITMFNEVTRSFSPLLRKELMLHINEDWIRRVYYFKKAPNALVMELAERLGTKFFAKREPLTDIRNCLCMIERGTLAHGGIILVPGDSFQEDMIVTDPALHVIRPTVSLTYCLILLLPRRDLDEVLRSWPDVEKQVRRCAARLAVCRVVRICADYERFQTQRLGRARSTLTNTFTALNSCGGVAAGHFRQLRSQGQATNAGGSTNSLFSAVCQLDYKSNLVPENERVSQQRTAQRILEAKVVSGTVSGELQQQALAPYHCGQGPVEEKKRYGPVQLSPRDPPPQPAWQPPPQPSTPSPSPVSLGRLEQKLDGLASELKRLGMEMRGTATYCL